MCVCVCVCVCVFSIQKIFKTHSIFLGTKNHHFFVKKKKNPTIFAIIFFWSERIPNFLAVPLLYYLLNILFT